jgi:hypothetical protein
MSHPNLFIRTLKKAAVPAKAAVEAFGGHSASLKANFGIEPKAEPAVEYQPAEWDYKPWVNEIESVDIDSDNFDSGIGVFEHWLTNEEGSTELGDFFNIIVERQASGYTVHYNKRVSVYIDPAMASENNLTDTSDVESYVEENYYDLDEDDQNDISDIDVNEDGTEWVEIEWTG